MNNFVFLGICDIMNKWCLKMSIKKEIDFNNMVHDILNNKEFISLKDELHHGISRLDHSLHVARLTYNMCDVLHKDNIKDVTRAALLHDFFKDEQIEKFSFVNHPKQAVINAQIYFNINELQENIIASHMFPVSSIIPKHKESWIVSLADKIVSLKECVQYKVPLTIGTAFLFFINFAIIQR